MILYRIGGNKLTSHVRGSANHAREEQRSSHEVYSVKQRSQYQRQQDRIQLSVIAVNVKSVQCASAGTVGRRIEIVINHAASTYTKHALHGISYFVGKQTVPGTFLFLDLYRAPARDRSVSLRLHSDLRISIVVFL